MELILQIFFALLSGASVYHLLKSYSYVLRERTSPTGWLCGIKATTIIVILTINLPGITKMSIELFKGAVDFERKQVQLKQLDAQIIAAEKHKATLTEQTIALNSALKDTISSKFRQLAIALPYEEVNHTQTVAKISGLTSLENQTTDLRQQILASCKDLKAPCTISLGKKQFTIETLPILFKGWDDKIITNLKVEKYD